MKIIIVGCGKLGKTIIENLSKEKHDIIAIDTKSEVISELSDNYDVMCIWGNGSEVTVLKSAGVEKADLFIATTESDEINMLSCFVAKKLGAKHTVCRIRDYGRTDDGSAFVGKELGISLALNPDLLTAETIVDILKFPSAIKVETFSGRKFEMFEFIVKSGTDLDGISIVDLKHNNPVNFLVCTVMRDGESYIPNGSFTLQNGDKVGIIAPKEETYKLLKLLGIEHKPIKNVMILGAGRTAVNLANMLVKNRMNVKIIEQKKERCEEISDILPNDVSIICANGLHQNILHEEGISTCDAFIALTGMDENNVIISCYAEAQGVKKVISKVNKDELLPLYEKLGFQSFITPQIITADIIVQYARGLSNSIGSKIETLYSLMEGEVEALEFKVLSDFEYLSTPLKDMQFKSNVLIAGILRDGKAIIPNGLSTIEAGDSVIIISKRQGLCDLSDVIAN